MQVKLFTSTFFGILVPPDSQHMYYTAKMMPFCSAQLDQHLQLQEHES